MTHFFKAFTLFATASAFSPSRTSFHNTRLTATENTDFDAPIPANPQSAQFVLENQPIVDDECYMGKEGDFGACVDFDPPRRTRSMNSMDKTRKPPKWAFGDDFDAPVPANPQYGTAVLTSEPVVDDECYMGKDMSAGGCVDFDPPKRENLWTNYMDKPRGEKKGLSKLI